MLKIYDTLTRELREFVPLKRGQVSFYQCGPTVYSHQHIGNLFSPVKGDLIRRSLVYLGYNVKYVRNVTDVGHLVSDEDAGEDKMAKGSKREGLNPEQIAAKYTALYHQDLAKLSVLDPDKETIATQYIGQMTAMVQELVDKGYAYATPLAIYFDISKFADYTRLSGQKLEENREGAGHGTVEDVKKRNPQDFAVWFFKTGSHATALQTWEHRFSGIEQTELQGFPGWHIECSAMSRAELGVTIDLHLGGREHIPVHHTNEIAQSEAANGAKFVNYWLHHEMLTIDGGKMSKSIGNVYALDDILARGYDALDYRYYLLQAHYRSKQNFTWDALTAAQNAYQRLKSEVAMLMSETSGAGELDSAAQAEFMQALENDFNIPQALAVVWNVIKSDLTNEVKLATILDFDRVLGLGLDQVRELSENISEVAEGLLKQRELARLARNWQEADALRKKLEEEHRIIVEDTPNGQKIKNMGEDTAKS